MKLLYLLIDFLTILVPLVYSFHPRLQFHKKFLPFFAANGITTLLFILWDIYFTQKGIWGFNETYITGIYLFNLPIEELLFFVCIPFACLFTYHCLNLFYTFEWPEIIRLIAIPLLIVLLFLTGILNIGKAYTASTFISLSLLLLVLRYILHITWIPKLLSVYAVLLLPFLIVNGILTGTGLDHPVVWYNDHENLGIRILSIPVEDVFYGFELITLNLFFFLLFSEKSIPPGQKTKFNAP